MVAKILCEGFIVLFSPATPTEDIIALLVKLAAAEKHMMTPLEMTLDITAYLTLLF